MFYVKYRILQIIFVSLHTKSHLYGWQKDIGIHPHWPAGGNGGQSSHWDRRMGHTQAPVPMTILRHNPKREINYMMSSTARNEFDIIRLQAIVNLGKIHITEQSQITEQKQSKLPKNIQPNYRI